VLFLRVLDCYPFSLRFWAGFILSTFPRCRGRRRVDISLRSHKFCRFPHFLPATLWLSNLLIKEMKIFTARKLVKGMSLAPAAFNRK
jgi:hypothetical protein